MKDINLSVKYLISGRLDSARKLVRWQSGQGIGFDQGFVYETDAKSFCVLPILIEAGPWGLFCLDGSHRVEALYDQGTTKIDVIVVSSKHSVPPPANLFAPGDVETIDRCQDWRERFDGFHESRFRNIAGRLDQLGKEFET